MRTSNLRFGFSFIEPKTWDRLDPTNGDGNGYTHPTKPDVNISVSGHYDVLNEGDVSSSVGSRLDWLKKRKGVQIIVIQTKRQLLLRFSQ